MTTFRSGCSRLFLVALAASLASTTVLAANAPNAPQPPNDAQRSHNEGPGEHHGQGRGIHHLLEGIQLRPEQRDAVMRLHREAMSDRVVAESATKPFRNELAKELRAGSFDRVILDRLLAASAQDLGTLPPVHVQMLAKLHAILDPAQRAQVADKLSKMPPMMGPPGEHPGGGGKANGRGRGHGPNGEHGPGGHAFFHKFTEDLDLTPSQRDAIAKAIHERMTTEKSGDEHAAMRAEMEARSKDLAERFRKDTFVVTDADKMPIAMAAKHLARLGEFTMVAAPILTMNQRQKLADHLEQGQHDVDGP